MAVTYGAKFCPASICLWRGYMAFLFAFPLSAFSLVFPAYLHSLCRPKTVSFFINQYKQHIDRRTSHTTWYLRKSLYME